MVAVKLVPRCVQRVWVYLYVHVSRWVGVFCVHIGECVCVCTHVGICVCIVMTKAPDSPAALPTVADHVSSNR